MTNDWRSMEDAPRDGTWVILDIEYAGDCYGNFVGRWSPKSFDGLGPYEWEVVQRDMSETNHWSDGRVARWRHLPSPTNHEGTQG